MSSTQLVVTAIVLISLVAGSLVGWLWLRSPSQRPQVGSQYDRFIDESDGRLATEREQRDRQRRHETLEFTELSPQAQTAYAARWRELQVQFVNSPYDAVNEADDLVTQLVSELGYPSGDLQFYSEAHQISLSHRRGEATPEQLRWAVTHFRDLVPKLIGEQASPPPDTEPSLIR